MLDIIYVLLFAAVVLCLVLVLKRPKGLPPGPFTLPVIGSFFFLNQLRREQTYLSLLDASKTYGKIFSFRIGSHLILVLNEWDAIHEALVKQSEVFSDRPNFLPFFRMMSPPGSVGILFRSYTHEWRTLKRFTLQALKNFGVGNSSIEEKIAVEIKTVSDSIDAFEDKPIDISAHLQKAVGNVISGIVFGKRFDYDDPEFGMIQRMSSIVLSGQGPTGVNAFFPRWVTWMFSKESHKEMEIRAENDENFKTFILGQINKHMESFDENNIRDFVDLYIHTRDFKKDSTEIFTEDCMFRIILELFIAGSETTINTLDWAFLFMSEYPEIQENCWKEISNTVGYKFINYEDRVRLPYVEATICEIQRLAGVVPLSVLHSTSKDTSLMGFNIPKGTIVFPNLYSALMDPKYWEEPRQFKPERFLDNNGKLIKHDALIPFGTGPRACLGEPLAKMELFLVFSNLLQTYKFEEENEHFKHTLEAKPNQITRSPTSYKLRINKRVK